MKNQLNCHTDLPYHTDLSCHTERSEVSKHNAQICHNGIIQESEISQKPHCYTDGAARSIPKNSNDREIFRFLRKLNMTRKILRSAQNDKVSTKDLRVFLGVWAGIFALFLALGYIKNGSLREWAACGVLISLALMIIPRIITPLYKAWVWLGEKIGFAISRVILALIFFGIFTPLGLAFRLFGRDILGLKLAFSNKDKAQSLFKIREIQPTSMKNQF